MFGQNRDALVLKFVLKLKNAVLARKDANAERTSENFIRDIMKKNEFNEALKDFASKQKNGRQQGVKDSPATEAKKELMM